jgi:3-oxoacyl-[acyl-carrier protein] reductase
MAEGAVFISGGSRGIGRAIATQALRDGLDVAFSYLKDPAEADDFIASALREFPGRQLKSYALDVRDSAQVDRVIGQAVSDLGRLDALVCNAGINVDRLVTLTDDDEWKLVIDTNLSGSFYLARSALDHFLAQKRGRIIMISSFNRDGAAGNAAYSASKAGLTGLARSIAKEYGPRGITCNVVAPGFVDAPMVQGKLSPKMEAFWLENCPLKRLCRPEEVANVVSFLWSEKSSFMNGAVVPVTGGLDWRP